jgi:tripartite-type tricarboxylate transporter receptor subunit TctC
MAELSFRGVAAAMLLAVPPMVAAQPASTYPDRPVRVVNPSSPGGGADVISRIVMQEVSKSLGQTFIIDNRPGAANIIATEIAAKAPPDGYTLLIAATGTFVTSPLLYAKLPYSINDFATISIVADAPFILSMHPSVPARTVKELVARAGAQDGKLTFASFGRGSSSHLASELFQSVTGTKLVHVRTRARRPAWRTSSPGRSQWPSTAACRRSRI